MQPMISTLTCCRAADVNAVHPHVNIILHVTALLIIVEDESPVSPQVKPVSFPPAQYGTLNIVRFKLNLLALKPEPYRKSQLLNHVDQTLTMSAWILTLSMEPATLHHSHLGSNTCNNTK